MYKRRRKRPFFVLLFAFGVFAGAFLLFQVQPLFGRFLTPWFGGTPEVWTACMLFFQLLLLAGYAYAHALGRLPARLQALVHLLLLITAAVLAFRIIPPAHLKPTPETNPIIQILWICFVCIGLPYFLLSSTGPLLQSWICRIEPGFIPYRLYALSNIGSLLALISYPFVFEPVFSRQQQAILWSFLFLFYATSCIICALILFLNAPSSQNPSPKNRDTVSLSFSNYLLWLSLPAVASTLLLAVTEKITQDIAVVPFLWILPLSIYLLSFIICFDSPRWYKRPLFLSLFILSILGIIIARIIEEKRPNITLIIGLYSFLLFCCCMVCHGELYALRPHPRYLTAYYLLIAAGGALGGIFVSILAPLLFKTYVELHLAVLLAVILVVLTDRRYIQGRQRKIAYIAALAVVGLAGIFLIGRRTTQNQRAIDHARNFFGVLTVWEDDWDNPLLHKRLLQHGTTFHGLQFQHPDKRHLPTAYYGFNSGIGLLIRSNPQHPPRRIGVIGLGVGTIAFYGRKGDVIRFYEINPAVERLARKYFTYLSDSQADIQIVLGDGRLSLERESPQNFDILVLDAFSSDAVPVHLLTSQAMEIYLKHLKPDGVLAFHLSSVHLDLIQVVRKLSEHFRLHCLWLETYPDEQFGALSSDWLVLSPSKEPLENPLLQSAASPLPESAGSIDLWTDDHIRLLQILKPSPRR
ncbi:MAG TPA: fused MFS/spermidine synthase [Anaerohalosphaeraceae bacterium]|mgnify:FL=1|nr:fused MFS/spermidine synthase [Anaerohalosphaeraceae bacterium]